MGVVVSGWGVAETLWYLHIACLRLKEVLFSLKSGCRLQVTHETGFGHELHFLEFSVH